MFALEADRVNLKLLENRNTELANKPATKTRDSKVQKITNLAKLWIPLSKRFVISGIKVHGDIIREEPERTIAMGAAWQPTFNPKPFDSEAAGRFLEHVGNFGEFDPQTPPPDHWVYTDTIFSMRDSQPGGYIYI